jgi:uncharacterized protein (DUF1015 family)
MKKRLQKPDPYIAFGCKNYYSVVLESESFCYFCKQEMEGKARLGMVALAKLHLAEKENPTVIKTERSMDEDNSKSVHCQIGKEQKSHH